MRVQVIGAVGKTGGCERELNLTGVGVKRAGNVFFMIPLIRFIHPFSADTNIDL